MIDKDKAVELLEDKLKRLNLEVENLNTELDEAGLKKD